MTYARENNKDKCHFMQKYLNKSEMLFHSEFGKMVNIFHSIQTNTHKHTYRDRKVSKPRKHIDASKLFRWSISWKFSQKSPNEHLREVTDTQILPMTKPHAHTHRSQPTHFPV